MTKKKKIFLIFGIVAAFFVALVVFMKSPLFSVHLSTTEHHMEAGATVEKSPLFYLDEKDWSAVLSYVDTSQVKRTKVGRYPVYIYHGLNKYTSYINVVDTTAPEVSCDVKTKTIKVGDTISVSTLGLDIDDYSEIENIAFTRISSEYFYTGLEGEELEKMQTAYKEGLDMWAEDFQFAYGGIYTLTIGVSDVFHNTGEIKLELIVEEPPVIDVPSNFYVASGSEIDYLLYIDAWDFISEDFDEEDVEIDDSQLNLKKTGTYPLYLTAKDGYGLTQTVTVDVHVSTQKAIQGLINKHVINMTDDAIIGAYNPYDSGYYEDATIEEVEEAVLPTAVHVLNDKLETFGSGFIIEITDEVITMVTNYHVIADDLEVEVIFYDGTTCKGAVVAADARDDIAFIRIQIDGKSEKTSLTKEQIHNLRTVNINESYWESLSESDDISIFYTCINENAEIWRNEHGMILEKVAVRDWNEYPDINETIISMPPIPGSSGSAIFDEQGRIVAMVRGYTEYDTYVETVAVPLNEILEYFEFVFKYKIQYQ